jgi:pyridoxine/pyridoxamine 5'-phosphate oxidase
MPERAPEKAEKNEILAFLQRHPMAVIATIHHHKYAPEAALVAFCETDEFEIIFQTFNDARKYKNIQENPHVAFVVGWDIIKANQITFQYEGQARELAIGTNEYSKYRTMFENKKTPCTSEFLDEAKSRIFVCSPKWFGYSDYTEEIPRIIENTFKIE